MNDVYEKDGRVIITKPKLKDWESGVIITCERCGKQEIIAKNSLCFLWRLCIECAREAWSKRLNKEGRI